MALAYTAAILEVSSIYTRCAAIIFIRLLLSTTNFPEAKLSSTFLSPIFWKTFKDLFACKFILTTKHQQPENIQRLFRLQICLRRKSSTIFRKYSKTFWATNSSNQQQQSTAAINSSHQQQQPTAATNSSNQQQPPAAAINSSNQQQQSTTATSSSNQQQQPATAINSSNQQQQSTAATSSSNQQQQSATAINSSNQQQQSTTAINSSNQKQRPATTINYSNNQPSSYQHHFHHPRRPTLDNITVPSTGYVLLEVDLGLAARLRVQSPLPRTIFVTFRFF